MDERTKRLLSWANGNKAYPLSIELSPTLRCNLNCLFCWRYGKKDIGFGDELSLKRYKEIIDEAAGMGVREIRIIGGGEPTFRRDTFEVMKEVKSKGMFGYICTNGTLFSNDAIKNLVTISWDHVKISLHGSNAETHDCLVGKGGAFKRSTKAITLFQRWKKKLGSKAPYTEIGFVLVKKNYGQIIEMVELAHKLNAQAVFIEPETVYTETGKKLKLSKGDYKVFGEYVTKAEKIGQKLDIENNFSNFVRPEFVEKTGEMTDVIEDGVKRKVKGFFSVPCFEPWYRMGIRVDGMVCPCGFFDQETTENVKEKSLKEIWFGEFFNKRREEILERKMPPHCAKCCVTLVVNNKTIRNELEKFRFSF